MTKTSDALSENFGQPFETQICIFVDPSRTFQTMRGIGGAITDASAKVFAKLPETAQKELLTVAPFFQSMESSGVDERQQQSDTWR